MLVLGKIRTILANLNWIIQGKWRGCSFVKFAGPLIKFCNFFVPSVHLSVFYFLVLENNSPDLFNIFDHNIEFLVSSKGMFALRFFFYFSKLVSDFCVAIIRSQKMSSSALLKLTRDRGIDQRKKYININI